MRKLGVLAVSLGLIVPATSFAEDPPGGGGVGGSSSSGETPTVRASLTLKLYRFGLSTSPTCENMTIYEIENPTFVDFTKSPELGSAAVPKGTYPCVALEIDQVISGVPAETKEMCVAGQVARTDICEAFAQAATLPPDTAEGAFDGVQPLGGDASQVWKTCKPGGDHLAIYLTTQVPLGTRSNAGRPPASATDVHHGYHLESPLVVTDRTTATLFVTSDVESYSNGCIVGAPTFSFETVN